jgi:hypothetical protein
MKKEKIDITTIREKEYHPAADSAMMWLQDFIIKNPKDWFMIIESIASTSLAGNRLSEILSGTISRIEKGEPVSDRYLLGLVWIIRDMTESKEKYLKNKIKNKKHV